MVSARYQLTDGAFLCVDVRGSEGVTYIFGSNAPNPEDEPVGLQFQLPI